MRYIKVALLVFIAVIFIDQAIKYIFVNGFSYHTQCISFVLTYNKGVAFSMLSFLGEYLKYLQLLLLTFILIYLYKNKDLLKSYAIETGLILGGGFSNLVDRFLKEGVVDYVYWHCGFDFAVFNFADVMIDLGVLIIILKSFKK